MAIEKTSLHLIVPSLVKIIEIDNHFVEIAGGKGTTGIQHDFPIKTHIVERSKCNLWLTEMKISRRDVECVVVAKIGTILQTHAGIPVGNIRAGEHLVRGIGDGIGSIDELI